MRVFPINNINSSAKQKSKISKPNYISFKSDINPVTIENAVKRAHTITSYIVDKKLKTTDDVNHSFERIFEAFAEIPGIIISPQIELLKKYGFISDITGFLQKICKPIAEVPSDLRDIVFNTEYNNMHIIDSENIRNFPLLYINNSGKFGFWNTIFNSQEARNDIKVKILSGADFHLKTWDIGLDKKGEVITEGSTHFNIIKSKYKGPNLSSYKRKSIDSSTTPV